jgi:hypothetical protein
MRRVLWFLPAIFLLCAPAYAQTPEGQVLTQSSQQATNVQVSTPPKSTGPAEWELFGGFSYLRTNINNSNSSFNVEGGSGSISENLNDWFGGRFTFNAWRGTESPYNVTAETFMYGPVFSYRRMRGATLFGSVQFGAIHASQGFDGISQSVNKFAMTAGGGFDYKIGRMAAFRVEGDYLMTRFYSVRQDNVIATVGLVFYLGKRKSDKSW